MAQGEGWDEGFPNKPRIKSVYKTSGIFRQIIDYLSDNLPSPRLSCALLESSAFKFAHGRGIFPIKGLHRVLFYYARFYCLNFKAQSEVQSPLHS